MANLKALKGTGKTAKRFGAPPPPEEASTTLDASDSAPAETETPKRKARAKTNRTKSWGTSVAHDFPKRIKRVAMERELKAAELLEEWLEAEEKKLGIS